MSPLSSSGWSVAPSFVPHGASAPVTLLFDDDALTQLAGNEPVAWQTPWVEIVHLQLARSGRAMALFGTVAGVRYCWRNASLADYDAVGDVVRAHGGEVTRRRRRAGPLALAVVLLVASFAGGIAAWLSSGPHELASARAVNLSIRDLPSSFSAAPTSVLGYLFGPANQVITSTPTTAAPAGSSWVKATAAFESCLGVSHSADRVYGAAGQMPDYQVTSPIFSSSDFGGIQLATITQYYATTATVEKDRAEMSRANFGACFARANAQLLVDGATGTGETQTGGINWTPSTYVRAWARGGVVDVTVPGITTPLHLVMVVTIAHHYEVTLGALVAQWPQSRDFLSGLLSTLKARVDSLDTLAV